MDSKLFDTICDIEEKNSKNFNDPFYNYSLVLDDVYISFLSNTLMCDKKGHYLEFLFNIETLLDRIESIHANYIRKVDEYRRWRIKGFERTLYMVLIEEANTIADNLEQCIIYLQETEDGLVLHDDFCQVENLFRLTMKLVSKTSKSISCYHLENLW